ncbi:MAG: hypothetical protein ACRDD7_01205 [Peptostreptococcaceae bacterium]
MIDHKDYDKIMKEHFDIDDRETRKTLLAIDEADQNKVLTALSSKLYDHIVNKVDDIDFGTIPNTKGDLTKLEGFDRLTDCLDVMRNILIEYKQATTPVDTINTAIDNIIERKELFEKGFRYQVELPMITYSTMVLSVISSTSFLVSSCIEFIKAPNQEEFQIVLDNVGLTKTKSNLLFSNLSKFNDCCNKKQIDNCLEVIIKNNTKNLTGIEVGTVVGGIALAGLILNIIPILRELIFFFYYSRTRVSDYFDIQADLLQMNAYNLQSSNNMNKSERDRIVKKQMKIVDLFRKMSNKISISVKDSENKASKEIVDDNKKVKTTEILDSMPDSASSALF